MLREHFNWQRLSAIGAVAREPGQKCTRLFLSLRRAAIKAVDILRFFRSLCCHRQDRIPLSYAKAYCSLIQVPIRRADGTGAA